MEGEQPLKRVLGPALDRYRKTPDSSGKNERKTKRNKIKNTGEKKKGGGGGGGGGAAEL